MFSFRATCSKCNWENEEKGKGYRDQHGRREMRATTDEHESRQRRVERGSCENVLYFLRNYSSVISSILQCFRFYKISLIQKNACRIFQIAEVVAKLFQLSSRMIPVFLEIFQKSADWRDQSKFTWNVQTMCRLCAETLWISPAFLKRRWHFFLECYREIQLLNTK